MPISFSRSTTPIGSATITLTPEYGSGDPVKFLQPIDYSNSGTLYSYSKGVNQQSFPLKWSYLPEAQYQLLLAFFQNVTNGGQFSCTYTDENGVQWTNCFLISGAIDFAKSGPGERSGEIKLLKQ